MSINKVILAGNVGKDPVIRYFDKGVAKATFPMATSETYTNQQGETITSTEWHNIVLWRELAEVAEKTIKKGAHVYIIGKIKTRSYVDKDGVNKYITEILADTLLPLEKKPASANSSVQSESGRNDLQDKSSSGTVLKEPVASYKTPVQPGNSNVSGNNDTNSDDFGLENRPESSQNEDDLPF
jgi:single-strand DNA-binding protein